MWFRGATSTTTLQSAMASMIFSTSASQSNEDFAARDLQRLEHNVLEGSSVWLGSRSARELSTEFPSESVPVQERGPRAHVFL